MMEEIEKSFKNYNIFFENLQAAKTQYRINQYLAYATDKELKVLIYAIYSIVIGVIPLQERIYNKLEKAQKIRYLETQFSNKTIIENVINEDFNRVCLLNTIIPLSSVLKYLLEPIVQSADEVSKNEDTL